MRKIIRSVQEHFRWKREADSRAATEAVIDAIYQLPQDGQLDVLSATLNATNTTGDDLIRMAADRRDAEHWDNSRRARPPQINQGIPALMRRMAAQ